MLDQTSIQTSSVSLSSLLRTERESERVAGSGVICSGFAVKIIKMKRRMLGD